LTFSFSNNYLVIVSKRNTAANALKKEEKKKKKKTEEKVSRTVTGFSTNRTETCQIASFCYV